MFSNRQRQRIQLIAKGRSEEPLRVLEGRKAVLDALRIGVVTELWLRSGLEGDVASRFRSAAGAVVEIGEAPAKELDRLSGTVTPQGVLALVRDTAAPLEVVCARPGLLLWFDGVQDPGNVGAVVRVVAAFGGAGVLVGAGSADPLGLKALRASAGLALHVPFARADGEAIATACAARDVPVWTLSRQGRNLLSIQNAPSDLVLVVGSEGRGPGPAARRIARDAVGIPMAAGVDSLNAAVATGIAVAHLRRGGHFD